MTVITAKSRWLLVSASACLFVGIFFSRAPAFAGSKVDIATRLKKLHQHAKSLEKEPDLPLLPKHPRRKFERGVVLGRSHGTGSGYSLSYEVADKTNNVIDWYENALNGLGWTVDSRSISEYQKNRKYLMATREGKSTSCTIGVFPTSYDDRRCRVVVRYSDFPPILKPSNNKFVRVPKKD